jgi:hypothetical protein
VEVNTKNHLTRLRPQCRVLRRPPTVACKMRKRPRLPDAISRLLAERVGASKARVLDEISSIAFAEPGEAISVAEKLNALALLSKVLGLQINRQEISGPGGKPLQVDVDASSARARIESRLGEIASRRAAELAAPSDRPIPLQRVGDVYSAVPARPYPTAACCGSPNPIRRNAQLRAAHDGKPSGLLRALRRQHPDARAQSVQAGDHRFAHAAGVARVAIPPLFRRLALHRRPNPLNNRGPDPRHASPS